MDSNANSTGNYRSGPDPMNGHHTNGHDTNGHNTNNPSTNGNQTQEQHNIEQAPGRHHLPEVVTLDMINEYLQLHADRARESGSHPLPSPRLPSERSGLNVRQIADMREMITSHALQYHRLPAYMRLRLPTTHVTSSPRYYSFIPHRFSSLPQSLRALAVTPMTYPELGLLGSTSNHEADTNRGGLPPLPLTQTHGSSNGNGVDEGNTNGHGSNGHGRNERPQDNHEMIRIARDDLAQMIPPYFLYELGHGNVRLGAAAYLAHLEGRIRALEVEQRCFRDAEWQGRRRTS